MSAPELARDITWPQYEAALAAGRPAVLPIGSFEQHGPHLPMGTDAIIAGELAAGVAAGCSGIALPALPYGAPSRPRSGGGDLFPAPDLPLPTLFEAIGSLAEGAFSGGAKWLIVVSWHLENAAVLWDPLRAATARHDGCHAVLFGSPWDQITAEGLAELFPDPSTELDWDSDHAGLLETALMLHLRPPLVGEPPAPAGFVPRAGYDVLPTPPDAVPATGCVNDPRSATASAGKRCFEDMAAGMAAAVRTEIERAA